MNIPTISMIEKNVLSKVPPLMMGKRPRPAPRPKNTT